MSWASSLIRGQQAHGRRRVLPLFMLGLLLMTAVACMRPGPQAVLPQASVPAAAPLSKPVAETAPAEDAPLAGAQLALADPAPAPSRTHTVQLGETINLIAAQYDLAPAALIEYNKITDSSSLLPGQILRIPAAEALPAPAAVSHLPLLPDAELVYGPPAKDFSTADFLTRFDGYLLGYEEEVEGQVLDGPAIVQLVADRHSVNPRVLLAVLEYSAAWLSRAQPAETEYPLGNRDEGREGLYKQLSWAANQLNWGFYARAEGGLATLVLDDETTVPIDPQATLGTVGVQNYLAARDDVTYAQWLQDIGPQGFPATYRALFGDPFNFAYTPLLPDDLAQPRLALPWRSGETWYFSGGPHGGWNSGSAWAALDFVPPDVEGGCLQSEAWVTAVAPGQVTRSGLGAVVVDLDGDGYAGTGWAITYMHLESRNRIAAGTVVATGDRIGHAACEGGFTNGTHLHLARTYNGRWISADGSLPFDLNGWVSEGAGYEYNGWLVRGDERRTADILRSADNAITAD